MSDKDPERPSRVVQEARRKISRATTSEEGERVSPKHAVDSSAAKTAREVAKKHGASSHQSESSYESRKKILEAAGFSPKSHLWIAENGRSMSDTLVKTWTTTDTAFEKFCKTVLGD